MERLNPPNRRRDCHQSGDALRLISIGTASQRYDIKKRTLRDWVERGVLPVYRINGRLVRFRVGDLEALITITPASDQQAGNIYL